MTFPIYHIKCENCHLTICTLINAANIDEEDNKVWITACAKIQDARSASIKLAGYKSMKKLYYKYGGE